MFGKKKNLNKYERELMFSTEMMKIVFVVIVILNMFSPMFKPFQLGFGSVFQYIVLLIHLYGLLNGLGLLYGQKVPILAIIVTRAIEAAWYFYISGKEVHWIMFGIFVVVDLLFVTLLILDKGSYEYVKEKVQK